jgi:hypothetical protein
VPATVPVRTERGRNLRFALGFVCLSGLAIVLPFVPHFDRVVLLGVMAGAYLGYLFFRSRGGRFDWFEIVVPYGAFFVLAYGVGALFYAFVPGELFRRSLDPYLTPALGVATGGFLAFLAGYAVRGGGLVRQSPLGRWRPAGMGFVLLAGLTGFAGQMANVAANRQFSAVGVLGGLVSAAGQFWFFFPMAWYLAWHGFWTSRRWRLGERAAFCVVVAMASVLLALNVGTKEVVVTLGAIPIVAFWHVRRRLPMKSIATLLLVVIFVVFPVYNTFRYTEVGADTGARLSRTIETAARWDSGTYLEHTFLAFLGRMAYVTSTAAVIRDVGRHVDYKMGETLLRAPVSVLIPRIVWPDKPNIVIGREFAETFRLIHSRDRQTQIGASSIGELYWNFGTAGVLFGMFLFGVLYRWWYRRYGEGERTDDALRRAVYVVLLTLSWNIEGGIASMLAGAVKILLLVTFFVVITRRLGFLVPIDSPSGRSGWSKWEFAVHETGRPTAGVFEVR